MGAEIELKLATSKRGLHQAMALPWLKKQALEISGSRDGGSLACATEC